MLDGRQGVGSEDYGDVRGFSFDAARMPGRPPRLPADATSPFDSSGHRRSRAPDEIGTAESILQTPRYQPPPQPRGRQSRPDVFVWFLRLPRSSHFAGKQASATSDCRPAMRLCGIARRLRHVDISFSRCSFELMAIGYDVAASVTNGSRSIGATARRGNTILATFTADAEKIR